MDQLKDKLEQALKQSPEFEKLKDYVQMSVTGEGLRVEMLESEKGIFFESGSGRPSEVGHELILRLGAELKKLPNDLMIEGHTDAKPFANGGDYSNWELSTDGQCRAKTDGIRRAAPRPGGAGAAVSPTRASATRSIRRRRATGGSR